MTSFDVRPLDETTWPDFARLVEKHNGVWGGCWCMAFHPEGVGRSRTPEQNRSEKERRVREGRAHAALVYDGATCVGWCQFGSPDELPRIKRKRAYLETPSDPPDWRITCFFADKACRGQGVASAALEFTTGRRRCSNSSGSSEPGPSERTTGWSPGSCPASAAGLPDESAEGRTRRSERRPVPLGYRRSS